MKHNRLTVSPIAMVLARVSDNLETSGASSASRFSIEVYHVSVEHIQ